MYQPGPTAIWAFFREKFKGQKVHKKQLQLQSLRLAQNTLQQSKYAVLFDWEIWTFNDINESFAITADTANNVQAANDAINSLIITGYSTSNDYRFEPDLERPNTVGMTSRWQARVVPLTTFSGWHH